MFSAVSAEMMQRLSSKQDYSRALPAALPSRRPSVQAAAGARPALGGRGALGSPGRAALRGAAGDAAAGGPTELTDCSGGAGEIRSNKAGCLHGVTMETRGSSHN